MGEQARRGWPFGVVAGVFYLALTVGMFGDLLFSRTVMVSAPGNDVTTYILGLKGYGFSALAGGRFPGWNPHEFCGTPFAANLQTGLFYPPNWLRLVLPDVTGLNVSIALHFWLAGWGTALWAWARTRSRPASLLAGAAFACCGGYFLHVYPGHEIVLSAGAWSPAFFLCVDRILGTGGVSPVEGVRGRVRWGTLTAVVVAMEVLAGHPQVPYYTWLAAGIYAAVSWRAWWRRWERVAALVVGGVVGLALTAVQLVPTMMLAGETTRAGGMTAESVRKYALPWENLLTAVYPHLFGTAGAGYVGRWSLWEVSVFVGGVVLVLAAYAAVRLPRVRGVVVVVGVLVLLAGVVPFVQEWARVGVPGYGWFRAAGRFGLVIDLWVVILAAEGMAEMIRRGGPEKKVAVWCAVMAAVSGGVAMVVAMYPPMWAGVLGAIARTGESYVTAGEFADAAFVGRATRAAAVDLAGAAGMLAGLAVLLALWRRRAGVVWGVVALGCAEVFVGARWDRASGPPDLPYPAVWAQAIPPPPGRVLTVAEDWANVAMRAGFDDAYGYDSTVLRRYAMFLAVTQGADVARVDFVPKVTRPSALLALLRVRDVLYFRGNTPEVRGVAGPMPRFAWMHRYQLCGDVGEVYATLARGDFPFRTTVLLESTPAPAPAEGADGTVRVVRETPEEIEVEATTPVPAVLLMTDAYARGWSVRPAGKYELLPGDGAFRAIPLAAGTHHFSIVYVTPGLRAGAWVSAVTLVGVVGAGVVSGRRGAGRG